MSEPPKTTETKRTNVKGLWEDGPGNLYFKATLKCIKTSNLYSLGSPALLIHVCVEYGTVRPFDAAFNRLIEMRWSDLPPLETTLIPINIYDAITRVQEGIDTHMRRLSSEPPFLKFHPLDCHSQAACVEDWEAAW
ncbi:hypothetical protein C8J56DRAFT_1037348 [Mycena floridula]|nr:hypothetical protein C8J56DRAFT_1037348 [Mycena floridula]